MRLLHTSDWHLGRTFHGASLLDEQAEALDRIVAIAREAAVDLVVIAGDLYDRAIPPAEAVSLFNDTLSRLRRSGIAVVAIAGNHDSHIRVSVYDQLLSDLGVTIRGSVTRAAEPVLVQPGDGGAPVAVYPLPYLEPMVDGPRLLAQLENERDPEQQGAASRQAVQNTNHQPFHQRRSFGQRSTGQRGDEQTTDDQTTSDLKINERSSNERNIHERYTNKLNIHELNTHERNIHELKNTAQQDQAQLNNAQQQNTQGQKTREQPTQQDQDQQDRAQQDQAQHDKPQQNNDRDQITVPPGAIRAALMAPVRFSHELTTRLALERIRRDLSRRSGSRSVLVAHAFVAGGEPSDSERELSVGQVDRVGVEAFAGFDYVALGHLHGSQQLDGPRLAYSGTPLPYSFSEERQRKSVRIVELAADGTPSVEVVPLNVGRRLQTLKGSLEMLCRDPALEGARQARVRAILTDEILPPQAMARLRERFPHAVELRHQPPLRERSTAAERSVRIREARSPLELADLFFADQAGRPASPAEQELLRQALEWAARSSERSAGR